MKYTKKRNNKKPLACALGVLLALAPSFCIYDSAVVEVYAEDTSAVEQFVNDLSAALAIANDDYAEFIENQDANEWAVSHASSAAVNSLINTYYQNLKWAIDSNSEISPHGSTYSGYYTVDGGSTYYTGVIVTGATISPGGTSIVRSRHFNFIISYSSTAPDFNPSSVLIYSDITPSGYAYYGKNSGSNSCFYRMYDSLGFFTGDASVYAVGNEVNYKILAGVNTSLSVPNHNSGSTFSRNGKTWLGSGFIGDLPQLGESLTIANSIDYYNVLVDYLQDTYPDVPTTQIPYPTGYDPYNPEYPSPTDNYIGIPAEWTIENPQLPTSPTINFNKYSPDLSTLNPLDTLANYTDVVEGISFWWTLFEVATSKMHIFEFFMIFLGLAVAGYILWYLGS